LTALNLEDEWILIFRNSKRRLRSKSTCSDATNRKQLFDAFDTSKKQCRRVLALSFCNFKGLKTITPMIGDWYVLSASERALFEEWTGVTSTALVIGLVTITCPVLRTRLGTHAYAIEKSAGREQHARESPQRLRIDRSCLGIYSDPRAVQF
jgi:hypothetical protein